MTPKTENEKSSRLPGFFKKSLQERLDIIAEWADLDASEKDALAGNGLEPRQADLMIENAL